MIKGKMISFATSALIGANLLVGSAEARLVQILHTNDTHSFLDGATHSSTTGGSARLKSLIDYYKSEAKFRGIPSLVMDGGDFLEGNLYYMADEGMKSFEAHNNVGYQMVALGNHDYLMGARELDKMLGNIDLNFAFLAANVSVGPQFPNLRDKIKPYQEVVIDGIKIGVLGLTTNEFYYSWSLEESSINDPYKAAQKYEKILKDRGNDFVFALTHIGVKKDQKLAKKTSSIDLIVGGHSHTLLEKELYEKNKNGVQVPIVQAGKHMEYMGRLVVDLEKGKPLKVVSYEVVPVEIDKQDPKLKRIVAEADRSLGDIYGEDWLEEVIGHSDIKAEDPKGSKKWAYYITDAMREKVNADVAIHASSMNGENFPVGTITRRKILNSIPRVFDLKEVEGWSIYTAKIKGIWLRLVFETLATFGEPLSYSGIQMEYIKTPFGLKIGKAMINGRRIEPFKDYTVAFTEGIIKGAVEISAKTKLLIQDPKQTEYKIWETLQDKVIRDNNQLRTKLMTEENKTFYMPESEAE